MAKQVSVIESLLFEERRFPPDPGFASAANARPDIYQKGLEEFWEEEAKKRVTWFKPTPRTSSFSCIPAARPASRRG